MTIGCIKRIQLIWELIKLTRNSELMESTMLTILFISLKRWQVLAIPTLPLSLKLLKWPLWLTWQWMAQKVPLTKWTMWWWWLKSSKKITRTTSWWRTLLRLWETSALQPTTTSSSISMATSSKTTLKTTGCSWACQLNSTTNWTRRAPSPQSLVALLKSSMWLWKQPRWCLKTLLPTLLLTPTAHSTSWAKAAWRATTQHTPAATTSLLLRPTNMQTWFGQFTTSPTVHSTSLYIKVLPTHRNSRLPSRLITHWTL